MVQFVALPMIAQSRGGVYGGAGGHVPVLLQPGEPPLEIQLKHSPPSPHLGKPAPQARAPPGTLPGHEQDPAGFHWQASLQNGSLLASSGQLDVPPEAQKGRRPISAEVRVLPVKVQRASSEQQVLFIVQLCLWRIFSCLCGRETLDVVVRTELRLPTGGPLRGTASCESIE